MELQNEVDKNIIWVLKQLKKLSLILNTNNFEFELIPPKKLLDGTPDESDQRAIIENLASSGKLKIVKRFISGDVLHTQITENFGIKASKYSLEIIEPSFSNYWKMVAKQDGVSGKPNFDENKGVIIWGAKIYTTPPNSNSFFVAKNLFKATPGEWVDEIDILSEMDTEKGARVKNGRSGQNPKRDRTIYDTIRKLNHGLDEEFGVDDLFVWENAHAKVNPKYMD